MKKHIDWGINQSVIAEYCPCFKQGVCDEKNEIETFHIPGKNFINNNTHMLSTEKKEINISSATACFQWYSHSMANLSSF